MTTTVMLATLLLVTTVASAEATYRLKCPSDDVDRAIRDCTIVIGSRRSNLLAAYETRCVALWLKGAYARAVPDCDQSIRIGVSSPAAYLLSGVALAERGDHHGAVAYYSRSIELTPTTTAYYNRGTSYLLLGKYAWALEDFDRAIAGQPSVRQARINRAVALLIDGREKEEIRAELDRATEFISISATASAIEREVLELLNQRGRSQ
jgi:tetratricopeptide (TPR) repeat protein